MKTVFVLSIITILLSLLKFANKSEPSLELAKKEPDLIFSKINKKNLNKMKLNKKQKERLIAIKYAKIQN